MSTSTVWNGPRSSAPSCQARRRDATRLCSTSPDQHWPKLSVVAWHTAAQSRRPRTPFVGRKTRRYRTADGDVGVFEFATRGWNQLCSSVSSGCLGGPWLWLR
jgi:hypothetical protein